MPHIAELEPLQPAPAPRGALVALLVRILRPLVVLMLRQGMTAYEFSEVSRWVFAHAAMDRRHFAVRERNAWSMTKSRAAVLTGLTRREIDRLVCMNAPAVEEARETYHRSVRILSAWMQEPACRDANGRPRDLPIKGEEASLEWLVRRNCRDIPLRAMLDELVDRGCVVRIDSDLVRLVQADVHGPALSAEDLDRVGRRAEHFMQFVQDAFDPESPDPQFVEVSAAPECREALQQHIATAVSAFAAQMKRELSAHPKSLLAEDGRVVVGIYNGFL